MADRVVGGGDAGRGGAHVVAIFGASSGIGQSIALVSAAAGDELVLVARRKSLLESVAAEIVAQKSAGGATELRGPGASRQPAVVVADVRNEPSARSRRRRRLGIWPARRRRLRGRLERAEARDR